VKSQYVLIHISAIAKDVEHFSCIYCISPSENCLFSSFAHLFSGSLILCRVRLWAFCIFWLLIPCQMHSWQIFSHSVGCLFSLVTFFSAVKKLFSLMQSHLSILSLNHWAIGVLFIKLLPIAICSSVLPILSCSTFKASNIILISLIHFELMLVQCEKLKSSFNLLYVNIQFSQHYVLKMLSFLQCMFWVPLSKSDGCSCVGLCLGCILCSIDLHVCFCVSTMLLLLLLLWFFYLCEECHWNFDGDWIEQDGFL
jgi:hypothetical protein